MSATKRRRFRLESVRSGRSKVETYTEEKRSRIVGVRRRSGSHQSQPTWYPHLTQPRFAHLSLTFTDDVVDLSSRKVWPLEKWFSTNSFMHYPDLEKGSSQF